MFRRNDASSTPGMLSINTSEPSCEIFKPHDRVYWCSNHICNECGIVETRVGTSSGDPSTASYLITQLSDGSKIEIPGYLLRRSAKQHYHTRNRSTLSTCSSHTPGSTCKITNKIPQERKRRRHASGHPTMQSDTMLVFTFHQPGDNLLFFIALFRLSYIGISWGFLQIISIAIAKISRFIFFLDSKFVQQRVI